MDVFNLIKNFFLHKDFLPHQGNDPRDDVHAAAFCFSACVAALLIVLGLYIAKKFIENYKKRTTV